MINEINTNNSLNDQLKWGLLKYEITRFTISYCKQRTKKDVRERKYIENKLKNLRMFQIMMTIWEASIILKTELKKYMKNRQKAQD